MAHPSRPESTERRVSLRHVKPEGWSCELEACEKEERWPAIVRDVSATGMGVIVFRRFEPGTLLEVEFTSGPQVSTPPVTMRVVHARKEGPGSWLLGCILDTELTADELGDLL